MSTINELVQLEEVTLRLMSICSQLAVKHATDNSFISDKFFSICQEEEKTFNNINSILETLTNDKKLFHSLTKDNCKTLNEVKYFQDLYSSIRKNPRQKPKQNVK